MKPAFCIVVINVPLTGDIVISTLLHLLHISLKSQGDLSVTWCLFFLGCLWISNEGWTLSLITTLPTGQRISKWTSADVIPPTKHSTTESCQRPYCVENTGSLPNSEVKQRKARIVLGWVTAREVLRVLLAFYIFHRPLIPAPSAYIMNLLCLVSGLLTPHIR